MKPFNPSQPNSTAQQIISRHFYTENLYSLRSTRPEEFVFKAGQYARLGLEIDGKMVWRAYSITSAPSDNRLDYLLVTVPGGQFTSELKKLEIGAQIYIDQQSFGFMTPDRFVDGEILWMIATGTGVGPFLAMLREPGLWQQFTRLILVHGTRSVSESAHADEFAAMAAHAPFAGTRASLTYLQAISGELMTADSAALPGRITALLDNGALETAADQTLHVDQSRVMLCGNPAMIEDMRTRLHARQMRPCRRAAPGQFVTENYW